MNFRHLFFQFFDLIIANIIFFSLRLITDNASLWDFGHKGSVRVDLFFDLNFLNDDLLFYDGFGWHKVFQRVGIVYWQDLSCYKRVSKFFYVIVLECSFLILLVANLCDVLYEGKVLLVCHTAGNKYDTIIGSIISIFIFLLY